MTRIRASLRVLLTTSAYVVVELYKIAVGYSSLRQRTLRLQNTKPQVDIEAAEGYELKDEKTVDESTVGTKVEVGAEAVDALKNDWEDWALNAAVYA